MLVLPPLAMALPPSLSLRPNTKSSASSASFAPPPPPPSIRSRKEQFRVRSSPSLSSSARKRSLSVAKCTILPVIDAIPQDDKNEQREGTDLKTLLRRFWKVAAPYWFSEDKTAARLRLAAVFLLTLGTTGISVGFNFLGRDFYNALANKDQEQFMKQLLYYLGAFAGGIPVFVLRDYAKETLGLRWRSWMTSYYMERYFKNQTFYRIQSESIIDNPDQRIVDDLSAFTGTALGFSLTLFNAVVDLISFSNILFGIYPPLFIVLIVYSIGGTVLSVFLGRGLVNLNFMQEKKEADFRYGLVRIRENAESIAFYGGEQNELQMLLYRFKKAFENLTQLLISSRNLDFFTSGYRYLIQILPAAVVAPMYFSGKIEFGVINQSVSAFNHILGDFSLIVYQFQAISAFSAVIDRLGEFDDVLDNCGIPDTSETKEEINVIYDSHVNDTQVNGGVSWKGVQKLLEVESLSLWTPRNNIALIKDLTLNVYAKDNLLIMGPSGSGKTSLLRAMAGLWRSGKGRITYYLEDFRQLEKTVSSDTAPISLKERSENEPLNASESENEGFRFIRSGDIFFLPQRPYMVLGTLRQQLLYPTWREVGASTSSSEESKSAGLPFLSRVPNWQDDSITGNKPTEEDILEVLDRVRLSDIVVRFNGLDSIFEWSSVLSLGEQQRLAFARLLLAQPKLVFLDESTSALDEANEAHLYGEIKDAGITYISIGHRRTLRNFHSHVLRISSADSEDASQKNWSLELDP